MVSENKSVAIPADALRLSWGDVERQSVWLSEMIAAHCRETGERFDTMLIVPRGSYYPANIISRQLGFASTDMLHACIGSYETGVTKRADEFVLGQMPTAEQVQGKDILVIEEVCDTGHALDFLVKWLQEKGARLVRVGALHYKPSHNETGFVPDWMVEETDKWIVYPWEAYEEQGKAAQVRR